jgi:hypothetical protein
VYCRPASAASASPPVLLPSPEQYTQMYQCTADLLQQPQPVLLYCSPVLNSTHRCISVYCRPASAASACPPAQLPSPIPRNRFLSSLYVYIFWLWCGWRIENGFCMSYFLMGESNKFVLCSVIRKN